MLQRERARGPGLDREADRRVARRAACSDRLRPAAASVGTSGIELVALELDPDPHRLAGLVVEAEREVGLAGGERDREPARRRLDQVGERRRSRRRWRRAGGRDCCRPSAPGQTEVSEISRPRSPATIARVVGGRRCSRTRSGGHASRRYLAGFTVGGGAGERRELAHDRARIVALARAARGRRARRA